MSIDIEAIEYIYRERGIDRAFVEKDWYAVRVLQALSEFSIDNITPIFTGGTSLSKAHGVLQRFSEDLDFRARFDGSSIPNRTEKRNFRNSIIETLRAVDGISCDENNIVRDGLGFKIPLSYPKHFETPEGMRADLLFEFSYTQPRLGTDSKKVSSFVAEYKGDQPESEILCLSPVEIAADKLSALIWRVLKRNRDDEKDDPAMIRHLHDLCALESTIQLHSDVCRSDALFAFNIDMQSKKRQVEKTLQGAAKDALGILRNDQLYMREYEQFVAEMSYADDDKVIHFDEALDHFEALTDLLK